LHVTVALQQIISSVSPACYVTALFIVFNLIVGCVEQHKWQTTELFAIYASILNHKKDMKPWLFAQNLLKPTIGENLETVTTLVEWICDVCFQRLRVSYSHYVHHQSKAVTLCTLYRKAVSSLHLIQLLLEPTDRPSSHRAKVLYAISFEFHGKEV